MAKAEKPFHKITVTQALLRMYVEHGDPALQGRAPQEFAAEVLECFEWLMDFRNLINGMVSFNRPPKEAVAPFLD